MDEKSAAKFQYIKTVSGKVVAQSIAFRVVSIYWQRVSPTSLQGGHHVGHWPTFLVCKDLHLKCFKRRRAQELTDANCAAGMKRAKLLLQKFPQSATGYVLPIVR